MIPLLNTLDIQEGKLGRPFKNIAVLKTEKPSVWINRVERWHWLHVFKYVETGALFAVELDCNGNFVNIIKNYEFKELPN